MKITGVTHTFYCGVTKKEYESEGRWSGGDNGYWEVKSNCPYCDNLHWARVRL